MKINLYYGGRGLVDDPTIYVMNKITEVLEEIRVSVTRYNLYEQKNAIAVLPNTLKDVDGVILAASVEWFGIGGLLHQFLDACWLYADKKKMQELYMMPIAIATTYGEREAQNSLTQAWEILGGLPCDGLCAYVEDCATFEQNKDFAFFIEKRAESFYRTVNHKTKVLPGSNVAVKKSVMHTAPIDLTPQESEQLSHYVSDDNYVKRQKEDIEELTQLFKGLLDQGDGDREFIGSFKESFRSKGRGFAASYAITLTDMGKTLVLIIRDEELSCYYGELPEAEVKAKTTHEVMEKLVHGRITFQGAFMTGHIAASGNFSLLRSFDQIFPFRPLP